jgi:hypothetical protein
MQRLDYVVAVLGDLDIAAVTTHGAGQAGEGDLQRRPGYQGRALSGATINRYLTAASAVLTFASQRGYIQGKPVVPLQEEDGAREAVVSEALEAALFKWLTDHGHHAERLCFQVLIETGMRAGNSRLSTPGQITHENEWITLRAVPGEDEKQRRMVWIEPALARESARVDSGGAASKWCAIAYYLQARGESRGGLRGVGNSLPAPYTRNATSGGRRRPASYHGNDGLDEHSTP